MGTKEPGHCVTQVQRTKGAVRARGPDGFLQERKKPAGEDRRLVLLTQGADGL